MPKKFKAVQGSDGYVYPVTSTDLVVDSENKPITETLDSTKTKLAEHEANIERNANRINNAEERMTAIEVKNEQQDSRLNLIEDKNKVQDIDLKCLFADSKDGTVNISEEGNNVKLQNSRDGYVVVNEIEGNTLVNCNKEVDKELVLNGNIDTSGDNSITLTEGVNGGKVDVALEGNTLVNVSKTKDVTPITHESEDTTGNHVALADEGHIRPVLNGKTMVNVCDQKDPVAVTKAYTVENSGNHIALQGDVDGSCRPIITGKTLVNLAYEPYLLSQIQHIDNKYVCSSTVNADNSGIQWKDKSLFKLNTTYTIIMTVENTCSEAITFVSGFDMSGANWYPVDTVNANSTKTIEFKKTYTHEIAYYNAINLTVRESGVSFAINDAVLILEGDDTDKPIADYFEGLQ